MRFSTLIVVIVFLGIIGVSVHQAAWYTNELGSRAENTRQCFWTKKFIVQSFKNTCDGKGFESLEEWQPVSLGGIKPGAQDWLSKDYQDEMLGSESW